MNRRFLFFSTVISGMSLGCAGTKRNILYVDLEKDYFGFGLPDQDRCFVTNLENVSADIGSTVYLRFSGPVGSRAELNQKRAAVVADAIQKLGVKRLLTSADLQRVLVNQGVKFSFDREPDPEEWVIAEKQLGPFIALHVEYGIVHGSRRYIRVRAQKSSSAKILLDAVYNKIIWNDVDSELIYPSMNIYANWIDGRLRLRKTI